MATRNILPSLPYPVASLVLRDTCSTCGVYSKFTYKTHTETNGRIASVFLCESCLHFAYIEWKFIAGDQKNPTVADPQYIGIALPETNLTYVPGSVSKDFDEARKCFGAGCYNAFASMCRRTIQSIFEDKGSEGRTKIEKQFANFREEYPDEETIDTLDQLIKAGHDGAHPHLPEVSETRANIMLQLMNDLFDQLYNRPGRILAASEKRKDDIEKKRT